MDCIIMHVCVVAQLGSHSCFERIVLGLFPLLWLLDFIGIMIFLRFSAELPGLYNLLKKEIIVEKKNCFQRTERKLTKKCLQLFCFS